MANDLKYTSPFYLYRGRVCDVIDGDTLDIEFDYGFGLRQVQRIRLYDIDTPETRTRNKREKTHGLDTKWFVEELFDYDVGVLVESIKDKSGKYGRPLSRVLVLDDNYFMTQRKHDYVTTKLYYVAGYEGWDLAELLKANGFEKRETYDND